MSVKLFVLGRPGSGKSTAIHRISELASRRNYSTHHIKDYDILLEMYKQDVRHEDFCPADWDGFDVINFLVLDAALQKLEEQVLNLEKVSSSLGQKEIIMIEFARDDYVKALNNFSPDFLKNVYFLFVETGLETCIERIHSRRANNSPNTDHHSVSDAIMTNYYHTDNWSDVVPMFSGQHYALKNNGKSVKDFEQQVINFWQVFEQQVINFWQVLSENEFREQQLLLEKPPVKEEIAA